MGSGPDRETLKKLQLRGREEKHNAQQRRIKAREMEEMDRLKKLILSGRSPLDNCPPEMRTHPVFVFWRFVNKEVEKMNKARVDAYYRKYRRNYRNTSRNSHPELEGTEEETSMVSCQDGDGLGDRDAEESPEGQLPPGTVATPASFQPSEYVNLKYEDDGIKQLRNMTTVEELYQMADKIIGIPRAATDTVR